MHGRTLQIVERGPRQHLPAVVRDPEDRWRVNATYGSARTMIDFDQFFRDDDPPHAVIVQGDTATAFACAQAAFLARVPVAHVEAGLRTYSDEPWPEEAFRRQIGAVARWHFAPDLDAAHNVISERESHRVVMTTEEYRAARGIFVVGNTVIDTLPDNTFKVLATLHRRENWGARIQNAIDELATFAFAGNVFVRIIEHPNWSVQGLTKPAGPIYTPPLPREALLDEMRRADLIVTDSGGLQEEAAHFGIDTIVLRTSTERVALARTGAVELVDPDSPTSLRDALEAKLARRRCYGVGDSGKRIAEILVHELTRLASETSSD